VKAELVTKKLIAKAPELRSRASSSMV